MKNLKISVKIGNKWKELNDNTLQEANDQKLLTDNLYLKIENIANVLEKHDNRKKILS